jgi:hypothetical protein
LLLFSLALRNWGGQFSGLIDLLLWIEVWVSPPDAFLLEALLKLLSRILEWPSDFPSLGLGEETDSLELKDPLPMELLFTDSWQLIFLDYTVPCFFIELDFLVSPDFL